MTRVEEGDKRTPPKKAVELTLAKTQRVQGTISSGYGPARARRDMVGGDDFAQASSIRASGVPPAGLVCTSD